VERVVTIGVGRASSERAIALAEEHEAWLAELAAHPRVVAVGECGLDHYREHASPAAQRRAFSAQIGIAREVGKPLVIHTREAAQETLDMLAAEAGDHPVILHCFSLPERLAEVAERGYLLSFAGQVTFPRALELQAAARDAPDELVMVETDSPYLTPVPRRGRPNRPANVAHTLRFVAALRRVAEGDLDALTTRNAARVFGW
jgi:TatD DNase family protein